MLLDGRCTMKPRPSHEEHIPSLLSWLASWSSFNTYCIIQRDAVSGHQCTEAFACGHLHDPATWGILPVIEGLLITNPPESLKNWPYVMPASMGACSVIALGESRAMKELFCMTSFQ